MILSEFGKVCIVKVSSVNTGRVSIAYYQVVLIVLVFYKHNFVWNFAAIVVLDNFVCIMILFCNKEKRAAA